jgi:hypothetical protein
MAKSPKFTQKPDSWVGHISTTGKSENSVITTELNQVIPLKEQELKGWYIKTGSSYAQETAGESYVQSNESKEHEKKRKAEVKGFAKKLSSSIEIKVVNSIKNEVAALIQEDANLEDEEFLNEKYIEISETEEQIENLKSYQKLKKHNLDKKLEKLQQEYEKLKEKARINPPVTPKPVIDTEPDHPHEYFRKKDEELRLKLKVARRSRSTQHHIDDLLRQIKVNEAEEIREEIKKDRKGKEDLYMQAEKLTHPHALAILRHQQTGDIDLRPIADEKTLIQRNPEKDPFVFTGGNEEFLAHNMLGFTLVLTNAKELGISKEKANQVVEERNDLKGIHRSGHGLVSNLNETEREAENERKMSWMLAQSENAQYKIIGPDGRTVQNNIKGYKEALAQFKKTPEFYKQTEEDIKADEAVKPFAYFAVKKVTDKTFLPILKSPVTGKFDLRSLVNEDGPSSKLLNPSTKSRFIKTGENEGLFEYNLLGFRLIITNIRELTINSDKYFEVVRARRELDEASKNPKGQLKIDVAHRKLYIAEKAAETRGLSMFAKSDKAQYKIIGPDGKVVPGYENIGGYTVAEKAFGKTISEYMENLIDEFNNKDNQL